MDTYKIKMPDIGEGIAEVEIVEWHVAVGDTVSEDQVLADVMTDKASVEIPSPIAGQVMSLGGQIGDVLAVGADLIVLQPATSTPVSASVRSDANDAPVADTQSDTSEKVSSGTPHPDPDAGVSVTQHQFEHERGVRPAADHSASDSRQKVLASPSVRQRARQLDIALHEVARSNGDSPVSHRDLDQFLLARCRSDAVPENQGSSGSGSGPHTRDSDHSHAATLSDTQINVVGLRRQIANKMQESKRHIPHFSYVEEVDVTELEQLRVTLNKEHGVDHERLTLLPFIVRAVIMAVRRFPEINAHYDSDKGVVSRFGAVHMGIATQTDNGLMVPVVRDAHRMDLWECGSEIRRLAATARRGKAQLKDLSGSTLTISSLGSLGGIVTTPIINRPEVAIVGVNRIVERPTLVNGMLASRKMMNLSSSFDHRVVDGMNAAQFIQEVRRLLESPVLLFVRDSP